MIWFTADTHLFHNRILETRPFASLDEMHRELVGRWNARVARGDRVFHLGDVSLGQPEATAKLLARLHGQIHLVRGNHDRIAEHKLCRGRFASIRRIDSVNIDGQHVVLCHYAFRTWDRMHYGAIQLHGHSHGGLVPEGKQIDVGVDCWDYTPVSWEQIRERAATLPESRLRREGLATNN